MISNYSSSLKSMSAFAVDAIVGSSSLTLSWNDIFADSYVVRCSTGIINSTSNGTSDSVCLENHHTFSLCADGNTSSVTLDQLVPRTSYTCCVNVLPNVSGEVMDCKEGLVLNGGLSSTVVGMIGAAAGIVLALLVALLIAVLVACCRLCKKHR